MEGLALIPIADASQPGEARRVAFRMADEIGFSELARGRLGIVITEAATNLLKHAGGGQIIIRSVGDEGLEILAVDAGPGMRSVVDCLRDGYSTTGSAGTGLGAITRLASSSDIYSLEGSGTVLQAFCGSGNGTRRNSTAWEVATVVSPFPGETLCGDDVALRERNSVIQIMVADGLGHGVLAAEASSAARRAFEETTGSPRLLLEAMHSALRSTRGAAVAVAEIEPIRNCVRFCGIGNIVGRIISSNNSQHMTSMNGIVGHQTIRVREFEYEWRPESLVVIHSDGLSARWELSQYPGLQSRRCSVVAATLFRDLRRVTDDGSVLVGRQRPQ